MPIFESRSRADALLSPPHRYSQITARVRAQAELEKKLTFDRALLQLVETTGLSGNEFLHEYYQKKFTEISGQVFDFEADKLRALAGLLSLAMGRFHYVTLEVPKTLQRPLADTTYCLASNILPWKTSDVSTWAEDFDLYIENWGKLQDGRKTSYDRKIGQDSEIYLDSDWSGAFDCAKEFSGVYLSKLKELLDLKKNATAMETLIRNRDLKALVEETSRYPGGLRDILRRLLRNDLEQLEGDDPLSKLCANSVMSALYEGFDLALFEEKVVDILWTELADMQKSDEQRQQVELIRRQISGEIYEGIVETEVE